MFRRARIELAFSRGYNPVPRMTFGPALALGMRADGEVVDVDIVLDESAHVVPVDFDGARLADAVADFLLRQL